jgi:hypothetical protein
MKNNLRASEMRNGDNRAVYAKGAGDGEAQRFIKWNDHKPTGARKRMFEAPAK